MNKVFIGIIVIVASGTFAQCQITKDSLQKVVDRQILYLFLDEKSTHFYDKKDSSLVLYKPDFIVKGFKTSLVCWGKAVDDNISVSSFQKLTTLQEIWDLLDIHRQSFQEKYRVIVFFYAKSKGKILVQELKIHCPLCRVYE